MTTLYFFQTLLAVSFIAASTTREVEHGVPWFPRDVLLHLEEGWELQLVDRYGGVGLKQHQAGMRVLGNYAQRSAVIRLSTVPVAPF